MHQAAHGAFSALATGAGFLCDRWSFLSPHEFKASDAQHSLTDCGSFKSSTIANKTKHGEDIHHEAEVEHDSARKLIAEIEESGPTDDHFDAKVKVLSEIIRHHVKEEEQADGMLAEAKDSEMDLKELGSRMQERKNQLESEQRP